MDAVAPKLVTARARYQMLEPARSTVLLQARSASDLTIPGIIPPLGASNPHDVVTQPYSSLGARGVNNVAAKLLLSLFPPQRPFFKLEIDPDVASAMGTTIGDANEALAKISQKAQNLIESSGSRPMWMEVFRHLAIAGNALVFHPDDGSVMRMWRLDQYVVRRDVQGKLLEAIIEEEIYPSELADDVRDAVKIPEDPTQKAEEDKPSPSGRAETKVKLYTVVLRDEQDNIVHYQEVNDIEVPGSRGKAKADVAGWQALRWQAVVGSDYGRSMVSEYAGDFLSMEEGWKSVLQYAAEASRILRIVDPNSGIDIEELAAAETGDNLTGYADKIKVLQLEKNADFNILWEILQNIDRRLSRAFLLTADTVREAERVTAEEIRATAQELEDSFGGTYTVLSAEAQAPYARRVLYILSKQKKAPKLPKSIEPQVVTGFSALGEGHEAQAILDWLKNLEELFGADALAQEVNFQQVALRTGTSQGIPDVNGLLFSPAQKAANQQANQNAQTTAAVAPQLAKGAMDMVSKNPEAAANVAEAMNNSGQTSQQ
jgi:hypothetical protein